MECLPYGNDGIKRLSASSADLFRGLNQRKKQGKRLTLLKTVGFPWLRLSGREGLLFVLVVLIGGIDKAGGTTGQHRLTQRQSLLGLKGCGTSPCSSTLVALLFGGFLLRNRHGCNTLNLTTLQAYDKKQPLHNGCPYPCIDMAVPTAVIHSP